jgi:AcrR family transcriptional regulator
MPDKSYHHGDLKSQLIREGLKLLNKEGYDGFSLRKVARACNVSQTAPYRHYTNKDELIAAIATQAMQDFNERLEQAASGHPDDPAQQLREMGTAYIVFFMETPEYQRLLFFSDNKLKTWLAGYMETIGGHDAHKKSGHPFATLYEAVARFRRTYPGGDMGQDETVLYCWALVHGIAMLIAGGELPGNADTLALANRILHSKIL